MTNIAMIHRNYRMIGDVPYGVIEPMLAEAGAGDREFAQPAHPGVDLVRADVDPRLPRAATEQAQDDAAGDIKGNVVAHGSLL